MLKVRGVLTLIGSQSSIERESHTLGEVKWKLSKFGLFECHCNYNLFRCKYIVVIVWLYIEEGRE